MCFCVFFKGMILKSYNLEGIYSIILKFVETIAVSGNSGPPGKNQIIKKQKSLRVKARERRS